VSRPRLPANTSRQGGGAGAGRSETVVIAPSLASARRPTLLSTNR
jgi:hypothetical protein